MATDKKFSQLPPVVIPQPTDQFGCNQAGVSKRQSRLQLHTLEVGEHLLLPSVNEPATPTLQIGSNSGFFEEANNILGISIDGVSRFSWTTGQFRGNNTNAGAIVNENATLVNPTLIPNRAILGSGIGGDTFGRVVAISNNVAGTTWAETLGRILVSDQASVGLTASTTQTQGQQSLFSSYNEISVVANANDVVTAPSVEEGAHLVIINNGANVLQVFPSSGDDIGAGVDTSITIKAGEIGEFIGRTAVVWDTLFNGAASGGVPDPLLLGDGSAGAPTYSFASDPDSGVFRLGANQLAFAVNGIGQWVINPTELSAFVSGGPLLRNFDSTAIVPNIITDSGDVNTGIGSAGPDILSFIAGGVEIARATEALNANQFAIVSSGGTNVPELTSLADPDTGFRWAGTNQLVFIGGTVPAWNWTTGQFFSSFSDGPAMVNGVGDITNAGFLPQRGDIDTGLGGDGFDSVSLVAGGIAGLRLKELNSGVVQAPVADVAITAFATGGQASAVALKQSYNVLATVATTGDSVKLPATFNINSIIYIKNDGANSADVFPATGDDLGQGLNTAEALASGVSAAYIATAANATWTLLLASAAGVPDPLLLGDGTKTNPTYSFSADPDTGMYTSFDGVLAFTAAGVEAWKMTGDLLVGFVANGPQMRNRAATATIPTLIPHTGDPTTGIGAQAAGNWSLISGGVETMRGVNTAGVDQVIIHPGFIPNDPVTPSLAFGDGDTGFFESADDSLRVAVAGAAKFNFTGNVFQSEIGSGPAMVNVAISPSLPQFCPNNFDLDTGLGSPGQDQISLIAGTVEAVRHVEGSGVRILTSRQSDVGLTAAVSSVQGGGLMGSTYNVFSTVANVGDAATLPSGHPLGTQVWVINDGANSMDVFPNTGDDAGAGTNIAVAVAAGASALFLTTVLNDTWTAMFIGGGGVPDPLLLGDGSAGAPTYSFASDPDTGMFLSFTDTLSFAIAGTRHWSFQPGALISHVGNGPELLNEASTNTNPTIIPHFGSPDSGLGGIAGQPSLIAGGLSCMSVSAVGAVRRVGFYDGSPIPLQTGVAVTTAAIHAALVALRLITA